MWYKNKRYIIAAFVIVIALIFVFNRTNNNKQGDITSKTVQADENPPKESTEKHDAKAPKKFTAEINFRKTTLTALHGDARAWDLDAAKVQMDEKTNKAVAFKVTGVFYDEKEPRATVVSSGADIDMNTKDILFHGEVQITTNRGEKAWSRFMRWDGKRQRLIGWDGVKLWKNDSIIVGTTLEADPSFEELSVKGNVNSVF